jgi:hypothetical protein
MTSAVEHEALARFPRRGHAPASVNLRLGEILVSTGQISERELTEALERKRVSGRPIGEELVAAGLLPRDRLVPALKLQRRLAMAAVLAALVPMGRGSSGEAQAGQTRAYMAVTATVVDTVSVRSLYQASSLVVTQQDVQRGYVDVPGASRFEIRNKGPCVFEFRAVGEVFRSVRVSAPQSVAEFGAGGGSMIQQGGHGAEHVAVHYRFALAPGVAAGAYDWPLALTVLPM